MVSLSCLWYLFPKCPLLWLFICDAATIRDITNSPSLLNIQLLNRDQHFRKWLKLHKFWTIFLLVCVKSLSASDSWQRRDVSEMPSLLENKFGWRKDQSIAWLWEGAQYFQYIQSPTNLFRKTFQSHQMFFRHQKRNVNYVQKSILIALGFQNPFLWREKTSFLFPWHTPQFWF